MDKKIIVNLDETGKITAETIGITGEVCLEELQTLLKDIAEIQEVKKTDEYFMESNTVPKIKQQNQQKLKK